MKLRIARKMDHTLHIAPNKRQSKRPSWSIYNCEQLLRAERRLSRSWRTHAERGVDENGRKWTRVGDQPDFFAMNRVNSRRIRRGALIKRRMVKP